MADVLVVDDDARTCRALERLLLAAGYTAETAGGGRAALAYLSGRRPGLLLLDWLMPDVGGPDVLRGVRRAPHLGGLPVVVYTALSDSATEGEAKRLGACDLVPKSGGWGALHPLLRKHLR
jgi:DNA-binding response OmpR family regulator